MKIYRVFPPQCLYSISEDDIFQTETDIFQTEIDRYSKKNSSDFIEKLELINISEIRYDLCLSAKNFTFISDIISSPNTQVKLRKVELRTHNLDESIKLLNLLSDCKNLESVELNYRNKIVPDIFHTPVEIIRKAINEFYNKIGIGWKVKIYNKV